MRIAVTDEGRARRADGSTPGFGLVGMRERVELLGGRRRRRRPCGGWSLVRDDAGRVRAVIRALLVDDQQLVRAGLRMLCEATDDIEVVGEAADGHEAIRLAERLTPDVVLMDLRMPGVDGITATARILAARPTTRVLVLTTFDDDEHLYPALAAGAQGFLGKDAPPESCWPRSAAPRPASRRSARRCCGDWCVPP